MIGATEFRPPRTPEAKRGDATTGGGKGGQERTCGGLGARLFTPESPRPTLESAPDHDQRSSRRPHRWLVSSCAKGVQDSLTPPEHQVLCSTYYAHPFPHLSSHPPSLLRGVRGGRNSVAPIITDILPVFLKPYGQRSVFLGKAWPKANVVVPPSYLF